MADFIDVYRFKLSLTRAQEEMTPSGAETAPVWSFVPSLSWKLGPSHCLSQASAAIQDWVMECYTWLASPDPCVRRGCSPFGSSTVKTTGDFSETPSHLPVGDEFLAKGACRVRPWTVHTPRSQKRNLA
jgi:hypothetical protein